MRKLWGDITTVKIVISVVIQHGSNSKDLLSYCAQKFIDVSMVDNTAHSCFISGPESKVDNLPTTANRLVSILRSEDNTALIRTMET